MSDEENQLVAILSKLHFIGQRLIHTNFVLDQRAEKTPKMLEKSPENAQDAEEIGKSMIESSIVGNSLLYEIIVNLFNLIEAQKELRPHLERKNLQQLEDALDDAWRCIKENEELIKKSRNLFVAHGKLSGKTEVTMFDDLGKEPADVGRSLYKASHCAAIYIQGIIRNVPEYYKAIRQIQAKTTEKPQPQLQDYLNSKYEANEILKKTKAKLAAGNFELDIVLDVCFGDCPDPPEST